MTRKRVHAIEEGTGSHRQGGTTRSLKWTIERAHLLRELERARERERRLALEDALTGVASVQLFRERLRRLLAQARRKSKHVAVLFLDLDGFKQVNDRLGHAAGDRLLRDVAARLRSCTRETDTVARRGGDEFVVLLDDVHGPRDAGLVAQHLLERVSRPCRVHGQVVGLSASVGVALFPSDGHEAEELEERADLAMYAAKRAGGNRCAFASGVDAPSLPEKFGNSGFEGP